MNSNTRQSLVFASLVLGLSYLVFWGPLVFLHLRTANLVEGKICNPVAFALFVLGGFVPSIVGMVLTRVYEGGSGVRALMRSAVNFRIGYASLFTIVGYVALLGFLQIVLYTLLGGKLDFSQFLKQLPTMAPLLILGPISEEFGWRGFVQKRLSRDFSPVVVSIMIGVVWSCWHLPLFSMIGTSQREFHMPFIPFLVAVTSSSVIYTYVYRTSRGSLFAAILLHWLGTYVMQVIASQVVRTTTYNLLECLPGLLIACGFALVMRKAERDKAGDA